MAKDAPRAITANRLLDGVVVYLTAARTWSPRVADADVIPTDAEQAAALAQIAAAGARAPVVDVAAIDVANEHDAAPTRLRERIRAVGPTVRSDLART